jgi:hypothetical protein
MEEPEVLVSTLIFKQLGVDYYELRLHNVCSKPKNTKR